jgi:hypothetical protein
LDTDRVYAIHSLTVDRLSASTIDFLTADRVEVNIGKRYWPLSTAVIKIGKLVSVRQVVVGEIDHAVSLRILGDLFVFEPLGYLASLYLT